MNKKTIFTLGTGNRPINEFINILRKNNIGVVVDVRRFPTSRFEHFKKEKLCRKCRTEGIGYIHLGNELGGYRKGGYEEYTKTETFQSGIERLLKLTEDKIVCLVCAETLPWRCHRRFIGKKLIDMGFEVRHIIDERHLWNPEGRR